MADPQWLEWAKRLQAIAQNGLAYAESPFDVERYEAIRSIAVEMIAERSGLDRALVSKLFAHEEGYTTPKLDSRGVVFRDGKILLVREKSDGCWTLPGGWVDLYDAPSLSVEREVLEESGYRTRAVKLLALWDRERHGHPPLAYHIYKIVFLCELLDDEPVIEFQKDNIETDGVGFFARYAIPPLSETRVMPAQIDRLFELHAIPTAPTEFD